MGHTILLYGATGYSGRLIVAEAARRLAIGGEPGLPGCRLILAGRDSRAVATLAAAYGLEHRVFGLERPEDVARELRDVDVLLNAAGPFALTASRLARSALSAGCHYVDINGEASVHLKLDDLGLKAKQRQRAIVCSAGFTAAASDLLLRAALEQLPHLMPAGELGSVRIAISRVTAVSAGSMETLLRSLREQVTVARVSEAPDRAGRPTRTSVLWHEPVGKLERTFDFGDDAARTGGRADRGWPRIASAANLVDTLTARLTVARGEFIANRIESYVETGTVARLGNQLGGLLAPVVAMPWVRDLARIPIELLAVGPTAGERRDERASLVLQIEDAFHSRVIDWLWHTPNPYTFTAHVVVEVAKWIAGSGESGFLTPSEVLLPQKAALTATDGYLRACRLVERPVECVAAVPGGVA